MHKKAESKFRAWKKLEIQLVLRISISLALGKSCVQFALYDLVDRRLAWSIGLFENEKIHVHAHAWKENVLFSSPEIMNPLQGHSIKYAVVEPTSWTLPFPWNIGLLGGDLWGPLLFALPAGWGWVDFNLLSCVSGPGARS